MPSKEVKIELENLGFYDFFDAHSKSLGFAEVQTARVIAEHRGFYRVKDSDGEYLAKVTGKHRFEARKREDYPAVGDWVAIEKPDQGNAVIQKILPRKTILKKKYSGKLDAQVIAANVDTAFVVESLDRDFNLNRIERYLVLTGEGGVRAVIVLNKTDLVFEDELKNKIEEIENRFPGVLVIQTSTRNEKGLVELAGEITKGKTYCFLGSSGVGKSSLINKLLGRSEIKTSEIGGATGRGRHTTTKREMYFLANGGIVIDNPGTREVGLADSSAGLENVFLEIAKLSRGCKFADCSHTHEPGCAVLESAQKKELDDDKYQNYLKLKKENDYYEMTEIEKRENDRKFGKFMKTASGQIRKIKP